MQPAELAAMRWWPAWLQHTLLAKVWLACGSAPEAPVAASAKPCRVMGRGRLLWYRYTALSSLPQAMYPSLVTLSPTKLRSFEWPARQLRVGHGRAGVNATSWLPVQHCSAGMTGAMGTARAGCPGLQVHAQAASQAMPELCT